MMDDGCWMKPAVPLGHPPASRWGGLAAVLHMQVAVVLLAPRTAARAAKEHSKSWDVALSYQTVL